jgi:hypothetical protein
LVDLPFRSGFATLIIGLGRTLVGFGVGAEEIEEVGQQHEDVVWRQIEIEENLGGIFWI